MSRFSDTLVYLRKRDGLSQQDLADRVDISRSQIGMYETGRRMPSREVLEAIADIFNVSIDFLVGRVDSGEYSDIFRSNLGDILQNRSSSDIEAAGIDLYEARLIVDGAIPLTLNLACELSEQLGESLDDMLDSKKPTPAYEDGLSETEKLLMKYVRNLSSGQQQMLLAQMQVMIASQKKSSLSSAQE